MSDKTDLFIHAMSINNIIKNGVHLKGIEWNTFLYFYHPQPDIQYLPIVFLSRNEFDSCIIINSETGRYEKNSQNNPK